MQGITECLQEFDVFAGPGSPPARFSQAQNGNRFLAARDTECSS